LFTDDAAALAAIAHSDQQRHLTGSDARSGSSLHQQQLLQQQQQHQQHHQQHQQQQQQQQKQQALDLATAGGQPAPLSARGQLARTATLPVLASGKQPLVSGGRPLTAAFSAAPEIAAAAERRGSGATACSRGSTAGSGAAAGPSSSLLQCQELTLVLLDAWGDSHFGGLCGLLVLGAGGQPLPLAASQLTADPPDLNVFPGHSGG